MAERLFDLLRLYFDQYGYWTLFFALLLENAGLPVPGETVLLFASFLAFSERELHMPYIIMVGIAAATLGDNIGFIIGHRGGRPLLDRYRHWFHIPARIITKGERLFQRYGPLTIFFARFVFGMRVIAGPMAGVLRMPWKQFALFNFLGAVVWVTVISLVGYLFGSQWTRLAKVMKDVNLAIVAAVAVIALLAWWRYRRRKAAATRVES